MIAQPTITVVERDHKHDQFLLLACDGVTDVFQTKQLIDFTISRFKVRTFEATVSYRIRRGSIAFCKHTVIHQNKTSLLASK